MLLPLVNHHQAALAVRANPDIITKDGTALQGSTMVSVVPPRTASTGDSRGEPSLVVSNSGHNFAGGHASPTHRRRASSAASGEPPEPVFTACAIPLATVGENGEPAQAVLLPVADGEPYIRIAGHQSAHIVVTFTPPEPGLFMTHVSMDAMLCVTIDEAQDGYFVPATTAVRVRRHHHHVVGKAPRPRSRSNSLASQGDETIVAVSESRYRLRELPAATSQATRTRCVGVCLGQLPPAPASKVASQLWSWLAADRLQTTRVDTNFLKPLFNRAAFTIARKGGAAGQDSDVWASQDESVFQFVDPNTGLPLQELTLGGSSSNTSYVEGCWRYECWASVADMHSSRGLWCVRVCGNGCPGNAFSQCAPMLKRIYFVRQCLVLPGKPMVPSHAGFYHPLPSWSHPVPSPSILRAPRKP